LPIRRNLGNNAYISPHALIDDGLLDVCIMSEFPKVEAAQLAVKLFNKRLDKSRYMKIIRGTKIQVSTNEPIKGHMDGEPVNFPNKIDIEINPSSLHIIYNEPVPVIAMIETEFKKALQIPKEKLRKHLV
jgi:diacylglycerol kinase family enzyme